MNQGAGQSAGRVVAGIDEAGFGPLLGPLVVGASAWAVADDCDGRDLWRRLRGGVARRPRKRKPSDTRILIDDSKKLFTPQRGLGDLERGVLSTFSAMSARGRELPLRLAQFLDGCAVGWRDELADLPWYDGHRRLLLPLEVDPRDVATRANGLRVAGERSGVNLLGVGIELVPERRYNRLCDAIGNKGRLLFTCTARLIQRLFDRFGRGDLMIFCDKHGGRDTYREVLQQHWPDLHLAVREESAELSAYELGEGGGGRSMKIAFLPDADATYLPVALASMYCKYTREVCMRLLNEFWRSRVGEHLRPTAGYFADGQRFAREVSETAGRLGIAPDRYLRRW